MTKTITNDAKVFAKHPCNWAEPTLRFARPVPSREVGVRYDQSVRWGRFVGFEADDRGLLARVEFHDENGDEPFDVVSVARIVGLDGVDVPETPPSPVTAGLRERVAELEYALIVQVTGADYKQVVAERDRLSADLTNLRVHVVDLEAGIERAAIELDCGLAPTDELRTLVGKSGT